ncbi:MAG: replication-associated recombination protein A [Clostridia bacterium]|nr:replication-associated recombination protein A [Clostridia bacterium]
METLFDTFTTELAPLAERMRPTKLEEFVGQSHVVGQGTLLRRAVIADRLGSCIFYGPPGTGKTTLANIIAKSTNSAFVKLNAVSSGVSDAKAVIDEAKRRLEVSGKKTYLLLDECHRWNKAQSDSVLAAIEQGYIIFIGSTTENPFASMTRAIVSRCRVFEFKPLSIDDVLSGLKRAIIDSEKGLGRYRVEIDDEALYHIAFISSGDMRTALNALELAVLTTDPDSDGIIKIDVKIAEQSIQKKSMGVNESLFYDMLSAFCKSLRGSDPDAALFWASRLIESGCDPMVVARRLVVHSAEDVGMADPNALNISTSAMYALEKIGMPEGMIPLTEAIIYVCEAEKSNAVVLAMDGAKDAVKRVKDDTVPVALRVKAYKDKEAEKGEYLYPHNFGGYVKQQYLPDELKDEEFYVPSNNGLEKGYVKRKKRFQ